MMQNNISVKIGQRDEVFSFCPDLKFKSEAPGICCKNGKIKLPQLELPSDELLSYISGDMPEAKRLQGDSPAQSSDQNI